MQKRILAVGMNPSNLKINTKSTTRKRFKGWMESIGFGDYHFVNVNDEKGDFHYTPEDVQRLKNIVVDYQRVIALGNQVSDILKKIDVDHFKMPHPSGRNRKLNDPSFVQECLQDCKQYLSIE